ncbi:MAG: PhzF family phenazine biosynthesis protein [Terriglobales bacterium]
MAELRRLAFVQLDVFTSRALEGNSVAVFLDGRGLSDEEMQALAREMNLSETTFILPRESAVERERGVRVRIFTVQEELPFAGHPTLGTAFQVRGSTGAREVVLDLNVGKVPIQFEEKPGQPVFGEMIQVNPEFGPQHDREAVVRASGLRDGNIDPSLPIETISTGLPFTVVPLRGLEIMRDLRVDTKGSEEYLAGCGKTTARLKMLSRSRDCCD